MVSNEQELATAIMAGQRSINLHSNLVEGVQKIKDPSQIVWASVVAALVASSFFWAGAGAMTLGLIVGLPAILAVCGGVGGVVFVALGAQGTVCAFRLLMKAKTIDVLNKLRDKYELRENTLVLK